MGWISFIQTKEVIDENGVKRTVQQEVVLGDRDDAAERRKDRAEAAAIRSGTLEGL